MKWILILAAIGAALVYLYKKFVQPEVEKQEQIARVCAICGREFHEAYPESTQAGQEFCQDCVKQYRLKELPAKRLAAMEPEEVQLYCECMEDSEEASQKFSPQQSFYDGAIQVDPGQGRVRFKKFFYIYPTKNAYAIVHDLIMRDGVVEGTLVIHFAEPFFGAQVVKVKYVPKGLGKKKKLDSTYLELEELSAALGGAPLVTPKEFKHRKTELFLEMLQHEEG